MRAVELLETQQLVHAIATLKIAAATAPGLPPASAERPTALLAECRRRRAAMQRPSPRYGMTGPLGHEATRTPPVFGDRQAPNTTARDA